MPQMIIYDKQDEVLRSAGYDLKWEWSSMEYADERSCHVHVSYNSETRDCICNLYEEYIIVIRANLDERISSHQEWNGILIKSNNTEVFNGQIESEYMHNLCFELLYDVQLFNWKKEGF